jgi:hypothetical protein
MGLFERTAISPIPARTIADLELDEKIYKPDFEITDNQATAGFTTFGLETWNRFLACIYHRTHCWSGYGGIVFGFGFV